MIRDRSQKSGIGFSAEVRSQDNEDNLGETLSGVEPEDLVKYGLIPEFVGRLPMIATLDELDLDALVRIIKEPKNSLTKQYSKLFDMEGVEIQFRDDALRRWRAKPKKGKRAPEVCARLWKPSCWIRCIKSLRSRLSARSSSMKRSFRASLSRC